MQSLELKYIYSKNGLTPLAVSRVNIQIHKERISLHAFSIVLIYI